MYFVFGYYEGFGGLVTLNLPNINEDGGGNFSEMFVPT